MKQKQPEIIILCGGLGTRIKTISRELPKSMIKIHGKPFIQYQLELLKICHQHFQKQPDVQKKMCVVKFINLEFTSNSIFLLFL